MPAPATVPLGPALVNVTGVRAGDRNVFTVTLTSGGEPFDLAGLELTAQARKTSVTPEALDAVVEVVDAAAGTFTVRWPGDAVTTWLAGKASVTGVWDLQIDDGSSDPLTVAAGAFGAVMDVTRP